MPSNILSLSGQYLHTNKNLTKERRNHNLVPPTSGLLLFLVTLVLPRPTRGLITLETRERLRLESAEVVIVRQDGTAYRQHLIERSIVPIVTNLGFGVSWHHVTKGAV